MNEKARIELIELQSESFRKSLVLMAQFAAITMGGCLVAFIACLI